MRVTGLDLSLTSTGWATVTTHYPANAAPRVDVGRIPSKPAGDTIRARSTRIRILAGRAFDEAIPAGLVLVEGPAYASQSGHMHDRSGLWWLVVARLTGMGVDVVEVPPSTVKLYATGKGNADKDTVLLAAARTFPHVNVQSNDEADALWLAAMGARHLGHPIDPWPVLPKDRQRAMDKVSWPTPEGTTRP